MTTKAYTETCPHCGAKWLGSWELTNKRRCCVKCGKEWEK
jgi:hypothetical protein